MDVDSSGSNSDLKNGSGFQKVLSGQTVQGGTEARGQPRTWDIVHECQGLELIFSDYAN